MPAALRARGPVRNVPLSRAAAAGVRFGSRRAALRLRQSEEKPVNIALQIEPGAGPPPPVEYRWDTDTDILIANVQAAASGTEGLSGTVGLEGSDGAWVNLDVTGGRIHGVEIAVWPDVRTVPTLAPPARIEEARVTVPANQAKPGLASIEVDTALEAVTDPTERTIHFTFGAARAARTLRLASDILLDVDQRGEIAGLWLLNVPPFPARS